MNAYYRIRMSVVSGIVAGWCGYGALAQTPSDFLDSSTHFAVEVTDCKTLIEDFLSSDFGCDPRWIALREYVIHPEFGAIDSKQLDVLNDTKSILMRDLLPGQLVFSLTDLRRGRWQLVFESAGPNPSSAMAELVRLLSGLDLAVEPDGSNMERQENSTEESQSQDGALFGHQFCWGVKGKFVFVSSDKFGLDVISKRVAGVGEDFKALRHARSYRTISSVLSAKGENSSSIRFHFAPEVAWWLSGLKTEAELKAWGLTEIVALGVAVHFCDSGSKVRNTELILDSFVKVTEPRTGIFHAINLMGKPKSIPFVPPETGLFWYVNLDWKNFTQGRKAIHDAVNGEGSFDERLDKRGRLGSSYNDELTECLGYLRGSSWYTNNRSTSFLDFREVIYAEKMADLILKATEGESGSKSFKYSKGELNSYPAVLADITTRRGKTLRAGAVFVEPWVYFGNEEVLSIVSNEPYIDGSAPREVEIMADELLKYVQLSGDISAMAAVFPEGVELVRNEWMIKSASDRIVDELRKQYKGDREKILNEFMDSVRNLKGLSFGAPTSKRECSDFATFTLLRIVSDSFSKWIFLGSDEHGGFRIVGKSFRVGSKN